VAMLVNYDLNRLRAYLKKQNKEELCQKK